MGCLSCLLKVTFLTLNALIPDCAKPASTETAKPRPQLSSLQAAQDGVPAAFKENVTMVGHFPRVAAGRSEGLNKALRGLQGGSAGTGPMPHLTT